MDLRILSRHRFSIPEEYSEIKEKIIHTPIVSVHLLSNGSIEDTNNMVLRVVKG